MSGLGMMPPTNRVLLLRGQPQSADGAASMAAVRLFATRGPCDRQRRASLTVSVRAPGGGAKLKPSAGGSPLTSKNDTLVHASRMELR